MATKKTTKSTPSWGDVKTKLAAFDRAGLLALVQNLYAASKDNKIFLHARLGLGDDPLEPYKDIIIRWINPPDFRNPISVAKAKKAISDYKTTRRRSVNPKVGPSSRCFTAKKRSTFWPDATSTPKAFTMRWCGCSSRRWNMCWPCPPRNRPHSLYVSIGCGNWGKTLVGVWAVTSTVSGRQQV